MLCYVYFTTNFLKAKKEGTIKIYIYLFSKWANMCNHGPAPQMLKTHHFLYSPSLAASQRKSPKSPSSKACHHLPSPATCFFLQFSP